MAIVGEPGVGKTRLVAEFAGRLSGARVLRGRCLSYGEGITFWPVAEIVREAVGIVSEHGTAGALERLRAGVDGHPRADFIAARVAQAIGLAEGQAAAEEVALAIRELMEHLASRAPLLVAIDDIQWAEEGLLEVVGSLATATSPMLVVCLARPELVERRPEWPVDLTLDVLPPDATSRLVSTLAERGVEEALLERLAKLAGGNPLFAEELVAFVSEGGTEDIPTSLAALLAARLDALPPEERVALESGAVEGEIFHGGAVSVLAARDVSDELSRLAARAFIRAARRLRRRGRLPLQAPARARGGLQRDGEAATRRPPRALR